jgi:uncharacterized protein
VRLEFDPAKSARNAEQRGLPFDAVMDFNWETALINADERFLYSELRFSALGFIGRRLHFLCYTPIEDGVRVISFRKANQREVNHYEKAFD